jgi:hypothetical protein
VAVEGGGSGRSGISSVEREVDSGVEMTVEVQTSLDLQCYLPAKADGEILSFATLFLVPL